MVAGLNGEALTRELAVKLIAEANQIRASKVTVGPIHGMEKKVDGSTKILGGVRVTFIAPARNVVGDRRVIQKRMFYYDKEWGWYLYAEDRDRKGEFLDIVSQHKGRFDLR